MHVFIIYGLAIVSVKQKFCSGKQDRHIYAKFRGLVTCDSTLLCNR